MIIGHYRRSDLPAFTSSLSMAVLQVMWIVLLLGYTNCYENLSRRRSTMLSQSSTYSGHNASLAKDGDKRTIEKYCAHTNTITGTRAWFQVDLGQPYSINSVKIYYRREGNFSDDWKQYRFRQFYLDVSDSPATFTTTSQRTRCYTDNSTDPALPPNIIEIQCKQTARYVIVETKYIYPNDPGPILEICEIEVYGCEVGYYGPNCLYCGGCDNCDIETGCLIACSSQCVDQKCNEYGNCIQCYQGYWGDKCQKICPTSCKLRYCTNTNGFCFYCSDGYFGDKCEKDCYSMCSGLKCNKDSGFCTTGCVSGYYGNYCNITCGNCSTGNCSRNTGFCNTCKLGYYGEKCDRQCSNTCLDQKCGKGNGYCSRGCKHGFYGEFCENKCSENCRQINCSRDGTCINGCKPNWTGGICNKCDAINYGTDCSKVCSVNCISQACNNVTGVCTVGCKSGFYSQKCEQRCSDSCPSTCNRDSGSCEGACPDGKYGDQCDRTCNQNCKNVCSKSSGLCDSGCIDGKFGADCLRTCGSGCNSRCDQADGKCSCKTGWQGRYCDVCEPNYYGQECQNPCSSNCFNGTCLSNNGSCIGGCTGDFVGEKCFMKLTVSDTTSLPTTAIGAGLGAALFLLVLIIIVVIFLRYKRRMHQNSKSDMVLYKKKDTPSSENKLYTNIGNVSVPIEDPEEEPQIEIPEEAVYYNDLSVAKDVAVSDLLKIIIQREANEIEGFQKEFKSLPYGERFACETAKTAENMPRNRFKTTFPYDHSRVILEVGNGFTSDYINANYIENMEGKKEFIACQGPRENTVIDHWRMIWQENVEYIVMLTNLIEGPKVKCHQYWPDEGNDLEINPFSVTLVEEKVYAYFVERKMTVRKKRVNGSRTVVQYHYTRWPDHGTPNPLNLVVFHRHFRHKIKPSQHPIIVHCSAGIGRTGTFIALDVLSRYGKDKGKVNVIEYVKAMRKDRMTMIQNVDQYVFLYHALYEFFRRKAQYKKKDEFLHRYGDVNRTNTQKHLTNEFNELISLKPRYDAHDFKSGKKASKMNFTKSVLPVEQYLVYLTSHVAGRESYYNAVNVSSFTRAEEFISAQYPVPGAAIDLVRLLIDHESAFLISLNPLSEVKELHSWVEDKQNPVKLSPYTITKGEETSLTKDIKKITINITNKEESSENHEIQIFECLNWSSGDTMPKETSGLTNLIKQFTLDRKYHKDGNITVISKDGATCCGVFIAVYNAIEQLQQDDEVDIFTIVQQLQCRRPEMISTKEEYEFCFKTLSDFLNTDNVYANS